MLEQTETGRTIASIAELANCQVEADTRKEALQAIQKLLSDRAGNWFLIDTEQERVAREQAQTQLLQAARNLLATGLDIAQVSTILGLSEAQLQVFESSP